ncbi:hypothetical protein NDN08_003418 [Rhodosorus marinus]|uniref:Protein arginine N-methyltransferase domain-containing protein n=1 Tax=Rhodosorus marinus TaxID=101924 RepID=A0AAV8UWJ5_9RHOD|nr:hypothetical protein NDN08_003418 [Rhodosorus marinus]
MKIERVDEQANGNVNIFLRVEKGDESVDKLRTLAESESADLWKRRISADDEKEARKFYNAQISGKEYSVVVLDVHDDINQISVVDPYYSSYEDVEVHRLMLLDKPRTEWYMKMISSLNLNNKSVLDVGAGSGILSLSAASAGAKYVHAVEAAPLMVKALAQTFKTNKVDGSVHSTKVEDLELGEVDVIVSEWMGFYLLHESMLDSVILSRDKFLKPGGTMVPSQAKIFLSLVSVPDLYRERVSFWDNVYGYDMSSLKNMAIMKLIGSPTCEVVKPENLISDVAEYAAFDLTTVTSSELAHLERKIVFTVARDSSFHGICCFFDVRMGNGDPLSTSPHAPATHWKQSLFMLGGEYQVKASEKVEATVEMRKSADNPRQYSIGVSMGS